MRLSCNQIIVPYLSSSSLAARRCSRSVMVRFFSAICLLSLRRLAPTCSYTCACPQNCDFLESSQQHQCPKQCNLSAPHVCLTPHSCDTHAHVAEMHPQGLSAPCGQHRQSCQAACLPRQPALLCAGWSASERCAGGPPAVAPATPSVWPAGYTRSHIPAWWLQLKPTRGSQYPDVTIQCLAQCMCGQWADTFCSPNAFSLP